MLLRYLRKKNEHKIKNHKQKILTNFGKMFITDCAAIDYTTARNIIFNIKAKKTIKELISFA